MKVLNNLKTTKTIFYNHSCFLIWIYANFFYYFKTVYNEYKNSKYIISLVPFENDYLFTKWGINSVLMNNFITYNYNYVGVKAMYYIIKEIPETKLKIISDLNLIGYLYDLQKKLKLGESLEFVGYKANPEIYFKNASLHIFPSISESFGLVLCETKIFGIPNILLGLDYVSIVNGGTIIIYDDNSFSIAKEAIKILKNEKYRKKLGKEARKSMKKFKNELLLKKWIKLILSIYNGEKYYENLRKKDLKMPIKYFLIFSQINILKLIIYKK